MEWFSTSAMAGNHCNYYSFGVLLMAEVRRKQGVKYNPLFCFFRFYFLCRYRRSVKMPAFRWSVLWACSFGIPVHHRSAEVPPHCTHSKTKYKMYPIEVKSSTKYSFESLKRFKEKYKSRIGGCYIIHPRNLIEKDNILCIPPYMTICL